MKKRLDVLFDFHISFYKCLEITVIFDKKYAHLECPLSEKSGIFLN